MKLLVAIVVSLLLVSPVFAKGFSSGGSFSSGSHSFSSGTRSSYSSGTTKAGTTSSYSTSGTSYKPTFSQTAPRVSTSKPVIGGYSTSGFKVTSTNRPSFSRGYTPPAGSVVYDRGFSFSDFLFWNYLFNHGNNGQQSVVVQQPDGKKVVTKDPNQIDWMYYIDWAIMLMLIIGLIVLIIWFVNKKTQPKEKLYNEAY